MLSGKGPFCCGHMALKLHVFHCHELLSQMMSHPHHMSTARGQWGTTAWPWACDKLSMTCEHNYVSVQWCPLVKPWSSKDMIIGSLSCGEVLCFTCILHPDAIVITVDISSLSSKLSRLSDAFCCTAHCSPHGTAMPTRSKLSLQQNASLLINLDTLEEREDIYSDDMASGCKMHVKQSTSPLLRLPMIMSLVHQGFTRWHHCTET